MYRGMDQPRSKHPQEKTQEANVACDESYTTSTNRLTQGLTDVCEVRVEFQNGVLNGLVYR